MRLKILLLMYPEYEVKIFGHSIASGIADLFAVSLVDTNIVPSHKIALYSFGAPRTGNIKFARTFDNLVPNSFRIINGYDPIVRLPPRNPIRFYHHRTEVWYNNGMGPEAAYETSTIAENRLLSSDEIKSHLNDHYNYFGFDIFDC
uniref:Lipase_3 domain-containing protein n=1 Tax=Rhabditophanes sp. KR3021 TaxID=114890 RepID=A0AC35U2W2_9BILA